MKISQKLQLESKPIQRARKHKTWIAADQKCKSLWNLYNQDIFQGTQSSWHCKLANNNKAYFEAGALIFEGIAGSSSEVQSSKFGNIEAVFFQETAFPEPH